MPVPSFEDVVYVTNVGANPIEGKLAPHRRFIIPPGKTKAMSWADAGLVFGNPYLRDAEERDRRLGQVMCLYGAFDFRTDTDKLPQIRVVDDNGTEHIMLISDPRGQHNVATLDLPDDGGDPRFAMLNQLLAQANAIKEELVNERVQRAGADPIAQRNITHAPATYDTDVINGASIAHVGGGIPQDFAMAGAGTDVGDDLLPRGPINPLPRNPALDYPANRDAAAPQPAVPTAADLLAATAPAPAPGPRQERPAGVVIPRG